MLSKDGVHRLAEVRGVKARARPSAEAAVEPSRSLTGAGWPSRVRRVRGRARRGIPRWRRLFVIRGDRASPQGHLADVKADMEGAAARWGLSGPAATLAFGQREGGARARCSRRCRTATQAARAGAHVPAGQPNTRRPLPTGRPRTRSGWTAQPLPLAGRAAQGRAGPGRWKRRRRGRHPPPAGPGRAVQGPRDSGGGRGAALRGDAQGSGQAHGRRRRRAHTDGQPDPPHARDGADRDP